MRTPALGTIIMRAKPVNLTDEDRVIMHAQHKRWLAKNAKASTTQYKTTEDRDATLMFEAQQMRGVFHRINPLVAAFKDTDRIDIGGCLWWVP